MQSSLASVPKMNGMSKSGKDNMLSILVSSIFSVLNDFSESTDSSTDLSVLFKCLFSGDAIFAKPLMNLR